MKKIFTFLAVAVLAAFLAVPALASDSFDAITFPGPATGSLTGVGATASVPVNSNNLRLAKRASFVVYPTVLEGGTLDVKLQYTVDGTNYADFPSGAFAQLTASGSAKPLQLEGPFGYKMRYVLTNGATVSASAFTVKAYVQY